MLSQLQLILKTNRLLGFVLDMFVALLDSTFVWSRTNVAAKIDSRLFTELLVQKSLCFLVFTTMCPAVDGGRQERVWNPGSSVSGI